jgi:alanine racemase
MYSASDLATIMNAQIWAHQLKVEEVFVEGVCYDTRISEGRGSVFFALNGDGFSGNILTVASNDGHKYLFEAASSGIQVFVVNKIPQNWSLEGVFLVVASPLEALQKWAVFHRKKFTIPVVGITGSNGKTIVKEWLGELLHNDFNIYKSPRSFNSQLGVAVSLLGIRAHHQMALIEAGISQKGEMLPLWEMIRPSLTVLTGLGSAHSDGFESMQEKAAEKMLLCKDADVVVMPSDQADLMQEASKWRQLQPMTRFITWGKAERSSFNLQAVESVFTGQKIQFTYRGQPQELEISMNDAASASNAMTCFSVLFAFERWDMGHMEKFKSLHPIGNRMSLERGKRGNILLNDSYSMDYESLILAIDYLKSHAGGRRITAVLSGEFRVESLEGRVERGEFRGESLGGRLDEVIWIGPDGEFKNVQELIASGRLDHLENQGILIKGARKYELERVVDRLKGLLHKTVMEINLDALKSNFRYFRKAVKPEVKLMVMVKAQGYGSGSTEVAKELQDAGVDYLGVAYADEGVALREAGINVPIMVLNVDAYTLEVLDKYALEPVIYSVNSLNDYLNERNGKSGKIHLEIDTGMHRLGFEGPEIFEAMKNLPKEIEVVSCFSHFSVSEDAAQDEFSESQAEKLIEFSTEVERILGYTVIKHICNTAGIIRFPKYHLDMVRLGLGLYGLDPSGDNNYKIRPIASLKASVTQIREVKSGEGIGYGQNDRSDKDRKIATISMGYADGLSRRYSRGNGKVWLNGNLCAFVGNICMDMAMIDVTDVVCREGDVVEIFGENLSINEVARWGSTISYEVLTGISQRVPRVFVGE